MFRKIQKIIMQTPTGYVGGQYKMIFSAYSKLLSRSNNVPQLNLERLLRRIKPPLTAVIAQNVDQIGRIGNL